MEKKLRINLHKVPRHVAVIMDGNGRWVKGKGKNRIFGHKNAMNSINASVNAAKEIGGE